MMWSKTVWRGRLAVVLYRLANLKYQRDLWMGKINDEQENPNELICQFGDIVMEEYFLEFENSGFFNSEEKNIILKLNHLINDFVENWDFNTLKTEDILTSGNWIKISECAKKLYLNYFEIDEEIYYEVEFPDFLDKNTRFKQKYPLK